MPAAYRRLLPSARRTLLIVRMKNSCRGIRAASLLALLASGCGGGGGSGVAGVPFDQLSAAYAAVFCHQAFTCCDAAELDTSMRGVDEATCVTNYMARIDANLADYPTAIAAGRILYNGDRVRRCLDAVAALPCAQWGADQQLRRFSDCLHFYDGTIAPGGACAQTAECADGTCGTGGVAGVCVANAKIGESCVSGSCQPEVSCASDSSGFPTVCATPLADGAACSYDSDCASTFCEANVCGLPTLCNGV
jgi:hypothetical protein